MADLELMSGEPPASARESFGAPRPRGFTVAELFAALFVLVILWFAGKIFLIAFGGVLVAVFLSSIANGIARFTPLAYGWALAVVMILILVSVGFLFSLVGTRLAQQANQFTEAIPSGIKQARDYLTEDQWGQWVLEQSPDWGKAIAQGSIPRITDLASSMADLVVAMVIMLFIGLYCAVEPHVYAEGILRLVPIERRPRARQVMQTIVFNLRWWILGQLFAMACVGLITGTGLWIAGTPLALTLGVLAALLEIIPNIGPVLWLVPASLVALTNGPTQVMHVVIIYAVTHMVESYILIPLVQRRTVWLPPALSILAVVLLGLLSGLLGLLVAAPLALVAMLLVKMLYVEDRLGDTSLKVSGEPGR